MMNNADMRGIFSYLIELVTVRTDKQYDAMASENLLIISLRYNY